MFSVVLAAGADTVQLSDLEFPGLGKRSMPPAGAQSTKQKQLKNLILTSKNPLLSGNVLLDTEEPRPWQVDLLEASETESQPEEEFDIPPGLEAFAEKIGLEWDLSETASRAQEVVRSPAPAPVIVQDYALPQSGPEEEVWGDLMVSVSPMEVEGRQFIDPVAEIGQTATTGITMNENNNQGKTNQDAVLTEEEIENIRMNEKIPDFTESDYEELDAFLETGLESLKDGKEPIEVNEGQNFDIIKYAIGESGLMLDEDQDLTEDQPTKTTLDIDEDYVPDFKKIKTEPEEIVEMEPVENVSIEVVEETPRRRKRRVGRPNNNNPITITVIPEACKLSDSELKALKYQRTRELNNNASRRFRQRKKEQEEQRQQELEQLRARNYQLQETAERMEREVALLKAKVSKINL